MSNDEVWKPVPLEFWEDIYEVSNRGRVRFAPRLVALTKVEGYDYVKLRYKGAVITTTVHRLMAGAFIRPPKKGEVVNHINANRSDNSIENLEWTTPAGNNAHTAKLGRMSRYPEHPLAKIDPEVAYEMRRDGHSYRAIGKRFGVSTAAAWALIKRARKAGRFIP